MELLFCEESLSGKTKTEAETSLKIWELKCLSEGCIFFPLEKSKW